MIFNIKKDHGNKEIELSNFPKNDYLWLTVPVKSKGKYYQKFKDVEIDLEDKNYNKISKTIKFNYQSSPYFNDFFFELEDILKKK